MKTIHVLAIFLMIPFLLTTPDAKAALPSLQIIADEVAKIKTLLPAGEELAGAYKRSTNGKSSIVLKTGTEYLLAVRMNYVFGDMNHDGQNDLVVVTEAAPEVSATGSAQMGRRRTLIFLSDSSGQLRLADQNSKVALGAEGGGPVGDALMGVAMDLAGVVSIQNYGGSKLMWGDTEKFQVVGAGIFMVGQTTLTRDDVAMTGTTLDVDFITGVATKTIMLGANQAPVVTHQQLAIKPLIPFAQAQSPNF